MVFSSYVSEDALIVSEDLQLVLVDFLSNLLIVMFGFLSLEFYRNFEMFRNAFSESFKQEYLLVSLFLSESIKATRT